MQATTQRKQVSQPRRRRGKNDWLTALLLVTPGLLLLAAVLAYPVIRGVMMSFYRINLAIFAPPAFIGLKNYVQAFSNPEFLSALWHTLYIVALSISLEFVIALALAHLFNQDFPGRNVLRGIVLVPWMIAPVVVGLMWSQLLNQTYGIVDYLLVKTGLFHHSIGWLSTPWLALQVMVGVDVWRETPFVMIILLAGLQGIGAELYEAAMIDGAGAWQRFRFVTMPMLRPAIALALLMRTMIALRFFDIPWVMTRGGPAGATEVLGTQAYKAAFVGFRMGYGSAIASVVLILALAFSFVYIRMLQRGGVR